MKDYLVILAGSPRGGEATWKSLNKNVLKPLNADLAVCTDIWNDKNILNELAKFKWILEPFKSYEDYDNTNNDPSILENEIDLKKDFLLIESTNIAIDFLNLSKSFMVSMNN